MIHSKTEVTKLKPKSFEVMERLDTSVDVDLFSKAVISVVGNEHHCHPVIAGVTRIFLELPLFTTFMNFFL